MKAIKTALEEIFGLFVEDGSLAILVLLWIGVAAFLFPRWPGGTVWPAPLFAIGIVVILLENVIRSVRSKR